MKRLSITFGTILLVLGCFAFSPAAKADPPIVGLWDGPLYQDFGPPFETYDQWHSDGLEFEVAQSVPGRDVPGDLETDGRQDRPALPRGIGPSAGVSASPTERTLRGDANKYRQPRPQ